MVIIFHKKFVKDSKNLTTSEKKKLMNRLEIFGQDEFNPILNNHVLKGIHKGYRSINISGDLRALYSKKGDIVTFVAIDSHSNLYG